MEKSHDSGYDDESSQDALDDHTGTTSSQDALDDHADTTSTKGTRSVYKDYDITPRFERLSVYDVNPSRGRHRSASSSLASSLTSSSSEQRYNVGSWRLMTSGGLQIKDARPRWRYADHTHIWDVEFLHDGLLVVIAGRQARLEGKVTTISSKIVVCLDTEGRPAIQPFPGAWNDPGGVSVCERTSAIAITDTVAGGTRGLVTILRCANGQWQYKSHKAEQNAFRVALTDTDTAVCAVRWEKLVKYKNELPVWSRSIACTNELVPYIHVGPGGRIIVSTPVTNRVSVFSSGGQLLAVFPSWFIKKPTGVCTDSSGRVLVADGANHRVGQYTIQGHFIQTLVYTDHPPTCIALYHDKYLAVGSHFDGLTLYELDWH